MFDGGVPEQIQRFIASPPPPPPLLPHQPAPERSLPFPVSFTSFNTNHPQAQHMLNLDSRKIIHHHHDIKSDVATTEWIGHTDHDDDNHHHHQQHPWCSDEVLALLKFRSTVENWFPEFTWEHTSRKLAEIGFKRSPQECKEKFEEEERRYFNSNNNYNNHEVEEFYHHHDNDHVSSEVGDNQNKNTSLERREVQEASMEDKVRNVEDEVKSSSSSSSLKEKKKRKRKKEKRFGMLKGFCEGLVRNMIAQQEEMHKKLLEDMLKKEEEKIAKEEAWKMQEIERLNKEVEIRAQEQAMASDRNTNIIKFISNFRDQDDGNCKFQSSQDSRKSQTLTPYDPLVSLQTKTLKAKSQKSKPSKSEDTGKRWPRDEVLALINTRRNISNMNDDDGISSSSTSSTRAVPLWERISKKMLEIGYKRSAKRCKEKWENINKYFRKTKDVNKKRPLDSRTCPYFHQLTALYSQPSTGTTITTRPEENRVGSGDSEIPEVMHVDGDGGGEKSNVQFSGFDLEFS